MTIRFIKVGIEILVAFVVLFFVFVKNVKFITEQLRDLSKYRLLVLKTLDLNFFNFNFNFYLICVIFFGNFRSLVLYRKRGICFIVVPRAKTKRN